MVMAFWFTELACRDRITAMTSYNSSHLKNPFATKYDLNRRSTLNMMDHEVQALMMKIG
jgi:hypothetical protein